MNMKNHNYKLLSIILCTALLTACSSNSSTLQAITGSPTAINTVLNTSSSDSRNAVIVTSDMITYDSDDYYSDWKDENPNYIELNGTSARINGSGAQVNGSKITISSAGVYVISGKLNQGQIIVDVQNKGVVKLVLNGAEINCTDNAPVYVKNAGKTIISLQEGTQNVITDGEKYTLSDASTDEPDAAIFSKDDLTINGTGKLTVHANYNNGITSKDDLKITGGNIYVYSADDGLLGRDMLLVKDGNITIEAGGDGIKSTNDTDSSNGFIVLEGGVFHITSGTDAIQAKTSILVTGGEYTISSGGGSVNSSIKADKNGPNSWGKWDDNTSTESDEAESQSAKGIKATSDITIKDGTFNIDSSDDALHSNDSIHITKSDLSITSGDDGIHADASITIEGGKVNIIKSYEGIESTLVTVSGSETHIQSSDDGINVNGGNDGSSVNGRPGQNDFSASENSKLNISGGYIAVNAMGDGLDSNGSIYFTGGTAVVSGPTADNNGALDYNGVFEMSGGFLVAAGSSGMAEAPSEESKQNSILMYYPNVQQAGTLVHLKDSKGNTVVTFAPENQYQSVVISSPELKKDTEYTLYSGGKSTGSVSDGLYTDGVYQGGTKIVSFTITNPVTWLSETGITTKRSSGPGGPNNRGFGGKPDRPAR